MRVAVMKASAIRFSVAVLSCGAAATASGCAAHRCEVSFTCGEEAPLEPVVDVGPVCVADPASERAEDACGIFVSSSLGDDANAGTRALPVRTFEKAITLARSGPLRVYACAEVFPEAVMVPSGVEVWGGLDCADDWVYVGDSRRTVLAPAPDVIPLQVNAGDLAGVSRLADLRLEAADASLPGGSSIAMLVLTGAAVELRRSELFAGDGAAGEAGQNGGDGPATGGTSGWSGGPACSADVIPGGPAVVTSCEEGDTIGGEGGEGNVSGGGSGLDGQPEPDPNPLGFGLGGTGQLGADCLAGQNGASGADGAHGLGGRGPGWPTFSGWEGKSGQDGGNGLRGQGGGGGGGSRGGSLFCGLGPDMPKGGASGGSGGGGGCGGRGGTGGGYGGASIGLVTFSGGVSVFATSIVTGNGGDGGAGGLAQAGGAQGLPGIGGAGVNNSSPGCWGGVGGKGGGGGYGGGGLGGPSLGVVHLAGQPAALHDSAINIGQPGQGGPGGNPAVDGSAGDDGLRDDTLAFPR